MAEDGSQLGLGDRQPLAVEVNHGRPPTASCRSPGAAPRTSRWWSPSRRLDVAVAVVLPAHVVCRVGVGGRAEHGVLGVLERFGVVAGGRLHRGDGHDLHEVVDDHVAHRADGVVEVPAVLHSEGLGHRDLHARDVVGFHTGSIMVSAKRRYRNSSVPILPRKWSIRYSLDSAMYWWISAASARAEARSWPNGFSTTTRPLLTRPAAASCWITGPNRNGGISRCSRGCSHPPPRPRGARRWRRW